MASLVCPDLEAHVSTSFPVLTAAQGGALLDCLKMGGDLNELHIMYGHVLHWAIVTGKLDAAEQMLAAGANVNARGKHGRTPLHFASMRGNSDAVTLLLDAGAEIDVPCHHEDSGGAGSAPTDGPRPMNVARDLGHAEIVKLLEACSESAEDRRARWEVDNAKKLFELHYLRKKRTQGGLTAGSRSAVEPLLPAPKEGARDRSCCLS